LESRIKYPACNVIPYWLLCYWKLVRTETDGDFARAWDLLPERLPRGVKCPTVELLAVALVDHGLVDR
ncbi:MAG: hypothetical protein O9309_18050, partial [Rhizobium sp.]|nr:hypothetical protein [Rhizobium sp.]